MGDVGPVDGTTEGLDAAHDGRAAACRLENALRVPADGLGNVLVQRDQLGVADDDGEQVVEVVRHTGGHLAEGTQFLGLCQLLTKTARRPFALTPPGNITTDGVDADGRPALDDPARDDFEGGLRILRAQEGRFHRRPLRPRPHAAHAFADALALRRRHQVEETAAAQFVLLVPEQGQPGLVDGEKAVLQIAGEDEILRVVEQVAIGTLRFLQSLARTVQGLGHIVEGFGQLPQFRSRTFGDSVLQVTGGEASCALHERTHRPRDPPGAEEAEGGRQGQHQGADTEQDLLQRVQEGEGAVEGALDEIRAANPFLVAYRAERPTEQIRAAQVGLAVDDDLVRDDS